MNHQAPFIDKKGEELDAQRFQLLQDIATDLSAGDIFPTSFDLVVHLRKALDDPDLSLDRLAEMLSVEPLIPLHLIRLANSAFYRRGTEVKDLKAAIQRLGLRMVRSAAMSVAMKQLLNAKEMAVFAEVTQRLWEHSVRAACAAYVISRRKTDVNPDEAMLAGLVHDIGAFYLFYRFSQIEELRIREVSAQFLVARWHESIGYAIMFSLGVPEEIAVACQDHDASREVPMQPDGLKDVVYVSNKLAGGLAAWLTEPHENADEEQRAIRECRDAYQDLLEEIEEYEKTMRQVL